jgi:DtxR family Mn-dependent transcriptional regulator
MFDRKSPAVAPARQEGTVRLLDLKPGQSGHVCDVGGEGSNKLAQLSQYGLLPGTPIRLTQKHPVPIVQVGQTDLALDMAVAAEIYVDV